MRPARGSAPVAGLQVSARTSICSCSSDIMLDSAHMDSRSPAPPERAHASGYLPLLLLLFAASGCSALIYETVWYQTLQLAIGSTAVSLGFLLATFMGGLCLGSIG